jgi:hypothetical protein
MEDTLYLARQAKDEEQTSLPLEFHVSGPARAYILNIHDRFPQADSQLVERLGKRTGNGILHSAGFLYKQIAQMSLSKNQPNLFSSQSHYFRILA